MSERARVVLELDALPVLLELVVVVLLLSRLDVPVVLGGVVVVGVVVLGVVVVLLGCDSSTSPPDVLVVPRCIDAAPEAGTQLLDMLMLAVVLPLVLGVVPVPFAPFVVLSPVYR